MSAKESCLGRGEGRGASLIIGEVSERTGVPASTLRYYDRLGILPLPERVKGRRRYGGEVVERVALIQLAQQAGFRLAEIQPLWQRAQRPCVFERSVLPAAAQRARASSARLWPAARQAGSMPKD